MKPGGQRRKGHNFERYVAKKLQAVWPTARRGLTQSGGAIEPDVAGTPYWIECKCLSRVTMRDVRAAFLQAERDLAMSNDPSYAETVIVVTRELRGTPLVWYNMENGWFAVTELEEYVARGGEQ